MSRRPNHAVNALALAAAFILGFACARYSSKPSELQMVPASALTVLPLPAASMQMPRAPGCSGFDRAPRIELADGDDSNSMWKIIQRYHHGPRVDKWVNYFDVYFRYFARFRGRAAKMLEIGVQSGGSIPMWQDFFGMDMVYTGVDLNGYCKPLFNNPPRVNVIIADQSNRTFWREMRDSGQRFDIILDDGGHSMQQQIVTFEEAWDMLNEGGVYICEDIGTSYDHVLIDGKPQSTTDFDGGFGKRDTFSELAKNLTDSVNGHYINATAHPGWKGSKYRDKMLSIAFYDQMVVIEKGRHPPPPRIQRGNFMVEYWGRAVVPERLEEYKQKLASELKLQQQQ